MKWVGVVLFLLPLCTEPKQSLTCYACVKITPNSICPAGKAFHPCANPMYDSDTVQCLRDDLGCVAATRVRNKKIVTVFGCYSCKILQKKFPDVKCEECYDDFCNDLPPPACDLAK